MKIRLVKGDITRMETDAIVNAANSSLMGGGGVDGAIHRAGGPEILEECQEIRRRQGGCPAGEAVITTAGRLPSKYVIHTVGPVWRGGHEHEPELLMRCYVNSLRLAEASGVRTIAFPNISTGVYGFPKELAARIAVNAVRNYLPTSGGLEEVIFVCYDPENFEFYSQQLEELPR